MIAVTMSKQLLVLPPNQAHIPSPHVHGLQLYIVTPSWSAWGIHLMSWMYIQNSKQQPKPSPISL